MLKNREINLQVLETVANVLSDLNTDLLYVGGAVVSLYVTDEGADQPRPTKDIDISVQVSTYAEMDNLREELAKRRIYPAADQKVLYRYRYEDILLDFIPTTATQLGPTNPWLKPGFEVAQQVQVGDQIIKILPPAMFVASKWAAFKGRGGDPRTSHDFEDIIYVIDNNLEFIDDVRSSSKDLISHLKSIANEITDLGEEAIYSHLNPFTADERIKLVQTKLAEILNL